MKSVAEIDFTKLKPIEKIERVGAIGTAIISPLLFLPLLAFIFKIDFVPYEVLFSLAFVVFIAFLVVYHFFYKNRGRYVKEFAVANGLEYAEKLSANDEKGTVFGIGHSEKKTNVVSTSLVGLPTQFYDFEYATGSGKSTKKYNLRIMRLELPRMVPHMVIDNLAESGQNNRSTLPIEFDAKQRLNLEGDFYKYFTLYAPNDYAISALSVIAPDVMEKLLEMRALCDIEIIDNFVYFYWPGYGLSANSYEDQFVTVETIMKEISEKLTKDDIFASKDQEKLHATAHKGVRLKRRGLQKGSMLTAILLLIIVEIPVIVYQPKFAGAVLFFMIFVVYIWVDIIYNTLHRAYLRSQLRKNYGQK